MLELGHLGDDDVGGAFVALEPAHGADQGRGADGGAAALVDGRRDDQVDGAALVLEQHEDDARWRSRGAGGRRPCRPPRRCRRSRPAPGRCCAADLGVEVLAHQPHRVLVEGHPDRAVVGDQPAPTRSSGFSSGARGGSSGSAICTSSPWRTPVPAPPASHSASRRPAADEPGDPGAASPADQVVEGAGPGEPLEAVAAGARARGEVGDPGVVAAALALGDQALHLLLAHALDVAEADPHGQLAFDRARRGRGRGCGWRRGRPGARRAAAPRGRGRRAGRSPSAAR